MRYFDRAFIFVDGKVIGEAQGGSIEYQGDPVAVATLTEDLAGFTPVPKAAMVTVDAFVPVDGLGSFDAVKAFLEGAFVQAMIQMGGSGLKMTTEGIVLAPSVSFSATDSTKLSFKIHCQAKPFEGGIGI